MLPCAQLAIDIEKVILSDWGDTGSCCGKVDVPGVLGRVDSLGPSGPLLISEDDKHVHFRWRSTKKWH